MLGRRSANCRELREDPPAPAQGFRRGLAGAGCSAQGTESCCWWAGPGALGQAGQLPGRRPASGGQWGQGRAGLSRSFTSGAVIFFSPPAFRGKSRGGNRQPRAVSTRVPPRAPHRRPVGPVCLASFRGHAGCCAVGPAAAAGLRVQERGGLPGGRPLSHLGGGRFSLWRLLFCPLSDFRGVPASSLPW